MTETSNDNGDGNGKKSSPERDEKGRFLPGGPGGPGRGKKAEEIDLSEMDQLEAAEVIIRKHLGHENETISLKAASLLLKLQGLQKPQDEAEKVLTPAILEILSIKDISSRFGGLQGLERMLKTCLGCEHWPGPAPLKFNPE